jgi:UDP-2,3-diacylglucosamine pyrophosphatase LpxH
VREARVHRGLDAALAAAEEQTLDPARDRIVVFSDHHRGTGDGADDFRHCAEAYAVALRHYLDAGYRLFLLGDVEELWEQRAPEVLARYPELLALEAEFARRGNGLDRFWGNHDDEWASPRRVQRFLGATLGDLTVRESLRLRVDRPGAAPGTLFFVHGHQGSRLSDGLGWMSREVVRLAWRPLQRRTGISATTPARDFTLRAKHDRALYEWAHVQDPGLVMIAGHTHHPVFSTSLHHPGDGDPEITPCYFNAGCCSFPDGELTGLEIADGELRLVRWPGEVDPEARAEAEATGAVAPAQRRVLCRERLESVFAAVYGEARAGDPALVPAPVVG